MAAARGITLIVAYVLLVGFIARMLGYDAPAVDLPSAPEVAPNPLNVLASVWDAVKTFMRITAFAVPEVPAVVNLTLTLVTLTVIVWAIALIRGTSS